MPLSPSASNRKDEVTELIKESFQQAQSKSDVTLDQQESSHESDGDLELRLSTKHIEKIPSGVD